MRALEGAPAHTCGEPVLTWAACTSLSSVRVIADQNCCQHGPICGCKKGKTLVVPCLKMLSDSSLLTKSHSNSAVRVFCMSFNFPFLIPAFPYSPRHLRYINLYNSLSSRCPVFLCFKPMLIFFYSWEHFLSLTHFSPSPSSILLLKILGILQTLFQAPCPTSSRSCSHQSPLSLTALCSSLRTWLTRPGAEVSAPVIQTRGCRLSDGLCGPVSTV